MNDKLNLLERWIVRIILTALIVVFLIALYNSCSSNINIVKGKNHSIKDTATESVEADDDALDLTLRKKGEKNIKNETPVKVIDTVK